MYNRYISDGLPFERITDGGQDAFTETPPQDTEKKGFWNFFQKDKEKNEDAPKTGISGILKRLHLDDLDSGDILLILMIIFLVVEGENLELALILGLVLFLSLRDDGTV